MYFQNNNYKLNKDNPWQVISDETIILSPKDKKAHELNKMGTFVFKTIEKDNNITFENLCVLVCDNFQVELAKAQDDMKDFIESFIEKNIFQKDI